MPGVSASAAYAIDRDGVISWTDEGFADLAREHGQSPLADAGRVVGRPLLDFVAGERPRALQRSLIERARAAQEPLALRYRCDSPAMRRHAVLELLPQPFGALVIRTWFESVEGRPYLSLLDYERPRGDGEVRLCAWCNRVDAGGWREADEDALGSVATGANPPRIDHSVCEICELLLTTRPAALPTRSDPSGPP